MTKFVIQLTYNNTGDKNGYEEKCRDYLNDVRCLIDN